MDITIISLILFISIITFWILSAIREELWSKALAILIIIVAIIMVGTGATYLSFLIFEKETQTVVHQDEIEAISIDEDTAHVITKDGKALEGKVTGEKLNENSTVSVITTRETLGNLYRETTEVIVVNK